MYVFTFFQERLSKENKTEQSWSKMTIESAFFKKICSAIQFYHMVAFQQLNFWSRTYVAICVTWKQNASVKMNYYSPFLSTSTLISENCLTGTTKQAHQYGSRTYRLMACSLINSTSHIL